MKTSLTDQDLIQIFRLQTGAINLDTCYNKGFEAAQLNHKESDNPFERHTKEFNSWSDGFWAGLYTDNPQNTAPNKTSFHLPIKKILAPTLGAAVIAMGIIGFLELAA